MAGKKKGPRKPKKVVFRSNIAEGEKGRPVTLYLPMAHLKIIEKEADLEGLQRSHFLARLVRRQKGEVMFERPAGGPSYTVTKRELEQLGTYYWIAPPELRSYIDEARLHFGNISIAQYLVLLVNYWIGQPMGLKLRGDAKKSA